DLTLPEGLNTATLIIAAAIAVPVLFLIFQVRRRMARHRRTLEEIAKKGGEKIPLSLHPVIDPDICIGSLSCLKVCPEGDILGVVDGKAALINASACIGHGKCELECPVDAIKLVFGTSLRGVDLPRSTRCSSRRARAFTSSASWAAWG